MSRQKIANIADVKNYPYKLSEGDEILYLDTGSIQKNKISNLQPLIIGTDVIPSRARIAVKDKTILYSSVRPRQEHHGILIKPPANLVVSTGFITINADENIVDPYYLYLLLSLPAITERLAQIADTATSSYPSINPEDIGNLLIEINDDLLTQQRIGSLMQELDACIATNEKLCHELESTSRLIYDYWFTQFDFPDEHGNPYRQSGGKMIYSEELKCKIPEGWKVKTISDLASVKTGKHDANFATEDGIYAYFTCGTEILKCDNFEFDGHAILLAGNGNFNVKHYTGKFNAYQRVYVIEPASEDLYFPLFMAISKRIDTFTSGSNGSIVKFIRLNDVTDIPLVVPSDMSLFKVFSPIITQIELLEKRIQKLHEFRNWLLPMLLNGQLAITLA